MNSKIQRTFVALSVASLFVGSVLAGPTGPAYHMSLSGSGYGMGGLNGGAFYCTPLTGGADWNDINIDGGFTTFCAEPMVNGFGNWATIDDKVYFGDGQPDGVAVSSELRSVLAHWFTGGYDALGLQNDWSGNVTLQAYIWGELYGVGGMPNASWSSFYGVNNATIGDLGINYGGGHARQNDIKVMNLWSSPIDFIDVTNKQSQFVIIPTPGAAMLGLIGLAIAARMRRSA